MSSVCVCQIDLLIQETSRLLQLTIEHDPHEHSSSEDQVDGPTPPSEGPSPITPITRPPSQDINNLRSRIITSVNLIHSTAARTVLTASTRISTVALHANN